MDGPWALVTDPDDVKEDLRTELFTLLQKLRRLEYVGVAEIDRFLSSTFEHPAEAQIPKLLKFIPRMQTVKASFMPESTQEGTSGRGPVSKTNLRGTAQQWRMRCQAAQIKQEDFEQESPDCSRAPRGIRKVKKRRANARMKYGFIDLEGQPPPMALIHVVFCKMTVAVLQG